MKVSDLKNLIEGMLTQEVRTRILAESEGNKKDFYHIKCEGVPLATFESEKEAQDALPDYKAKHKGELIIEKGEYESHDDMMNKLDEMNDQLEETDTMEDNQSNEGNAFSGALAKAKEQGDNEFEVDGNEYDVNEDECIECGGMGMEEESMDEEWAEPPAFGGCSTRGQSKPGEEQPLHFMKRAKELEGVLP